MDWIKMVLSAIFYPIRLLLVLLIYIYKIAISPLLPKSCRFFPTCSSYMLTAIKQWGIIKGVWIGVKRICRCRPGVDGGYDFVPDNLKGELKWTY